MQFHPLEKTSNLSDGYRKAFTIAENYLMLIQHEGKVYVLESYCPHSGYSMLDSKVIGSDLRCPMHGYLFDIASGECNYAIEGPCRGLKTYEVVVEQDQVGVVV